MSNFDRLDRFAEALREDPENKDWRVLSTGETCYVLLAADRPDLAPHDSVVYMFSRVGEEYRQALLSRWAY